jgi:hypothetical protein
MNRFKTVFLNFVKDSEGHVAIIEWPNIPLVGWMVITAASFFIQASPWHNFLGYVSFGFLFTWAWLEITQGKSNFRRTFGAIVLLVTLYSHFK